MKIQELTQDERGIANYLVDKHKAELNRISPDCVSPLIALRKVVKPTVEQIGKTVLVSHPEITNDEWSKITRWINDVFFKRR